MCALSRPLLILLLVMGRRQRVTPLTHDDIAERWFTLPHLYYFRRFCAGAILASGYGAA